MKQYNYLVTFSCREAGFGTAYITRTGKLDSFGKLSELAKDISNQNNITNVAVSSFQLVNISHVKKEKKRNVKKSD